MWFCVLSPPLPGVARRRWEQKARRLRWPQEPFGLLLVVMPTNCDYLLNSHPDNVFFYPPLLVPLPLSLPLAAPTAQPSGRQPQVQMHRVWQGLQIQAPSEGTPPDSQWWVQGGMLQPRSLNIHNHDLRTTMNLHKFLAVYFGPSLLLMDTELDCVKKHLTCQV